MFKTVRKDKRNRVGRSIRIDRHVRMLVQEGFWDPIEEDATQLEALDKLARRKGRQTQPYQEKEVADGLQD